MLTGGHVADCTAGQVLLDGCPPAASCTPTTPTTATPFDATGAMPNIPPKSNRRWKNCFSPARYKGRNAIERMFCPYDRLATNYLAAVCIAATVSYWL